MNSFDYTKNWKQFEALETAQDTIQSLTLPIVDAIDFNVLVYIVYYQSLIA